MAKRFGNTNKLWILWGVMYAFCAVCGFLEPAKAGQFYGFLVMLCGMSFFIPPAIVIAYSVKKKRGKPLRIVRNISIGALSLTLVMLLLSILAAYAQAPDIVGEVLHFILKIISVPMFCMPAWIISIFGWACLLMASMNYLYAHESKKKYSHRRHNKNSK